MKYPAGISDGAGGGLLVWVFCLDSPCDHDPLDASPLSGVTAKLVWMDRRSGRILRTIGRDSTAGGCYLFTPAREAEPA